jgi:flagellar basal body-associated protein FliL
MQLAAEILLALVMLVSVVAVLVVFVWGAKKDGEEDKAVQRRLGIRRKTRLGP